MRRTLSVLLALLAPALAPAFTPPLGSGGYSPPCPTCPGAQSYYARPCSGSGCQAYPQPITVPASAAGRPVYVWTQVPVQVQSCGRSGCGSTIVYQWRQVIATPVAPVPVVPAKETPGPTAPPKAAVPAPARTTGTGDPRASSVEVKWWRPEGGQVAIYSGTGTVVRAGAGKSLIVTNAHVVAGPTGRWPNEGEFRVLAAGREIAARRVMVAAVGDLALVECDAELAAVPVTADMPEAGAEVVQFGFHGHVQAAKRGQFGALAPDNLRDDKCGNCPLAVTTVRAEDGDSGSGVFNARGELFAVTCGTLSDRPGRPAYHVPGGHVLDLLRAYDGTTTTTP